MFITKNTIRFVQVNISKITHTIESELEVTPALPTSRHFHLESFSSMVRKVECLIKHQFSYIRFNELLFLLFRYIHINPITS